ncbi:hypothetical protein MLD38_036173 [Melastoma candidum]|uniref:Uncharacterized protein n=1 Tax=Melastoma candidum TaxID=119954 RepID=A0ACB9LI90_9MYRT|nr:hypothetical protein MLD38_036173 [Melastoma candidum]
MLKQLRPGSWKTATFGRDCRRAGDDGKEIFRGEGWLLSFCLLTREIGINGGIWCAPSSDLGTGRSSFAGFFGGYQKKLLQFQQVNVALVGSGQP